MSKVWQYYLIKAFSRMICWLPYSWLLAIGKLLGLVFHRIAQKQRKRAIAQISERLNLPEKEARAVIRRLFIHVGQTFLEIMYTPVLDRNNLERFIAIENRHYLEEVLSTEKGAVILAAHFGNWEWLGATLALTGVPLSSVIKPQPNEQHTRILNEFRQHTGMQIFNRGTSELLGISRALKQGRFVGFVADQDAGRAGLFVDFLGKMASTPLGPATFARKFNVPVIPVFIVRRPEGGHRVVVQEPFYCEKTGNEEADLYRATQQMVKITENMIRQYPDHWLWFIKRWNTKYDEKAGETA
ncbi:MAG: lipid biosynthesis acyltransferase [Firmicutes bacterium]|nr:lipid biosynthesis acyltransferase [Bacillota bacterium]